MDLERDSDLTVLRELAASNLGGWRLAIEDAREVMQALRHLIDRPVLVKDEARAIIDGYLARTRLPE